MAKVIVNRWWLLVVASVLGGCTSSCPGQSGADFPSSANAIVVDLDSELGPVPAVFGVNRAPRYFERTSGTTYDLGSLYKAFGITSVRLHDTLVDLCEVFLEDTVTIDGNPSSSCIAPGADIHDVRWAPTSILPANWQAASSYDFGTMDEMVQSVLDADADVYLRLGESWQGPNLADKLPWSMVATMVYQHLRGDFAPGEVTAAPVAIEIMNEIDSGHFWQPAEAGELDDIFTLTRGFLTSSGATAPIGGAGFTAGGAGLLTTPGEIPNDYVWDVGASNLDFLSAHYYGLEDLQRREVVGATCDTVTLRDTYTWLYNLRAAADSLGLGERPLHITEWSLGTECENPTEPQRLQSFSAGVLLMMVQPIFDIDYAHFYAGSGVRPMFPLEGTSVTVRPTAWAMWAARKLYGTELLETMSCTSGACVDAALGQFLDTTTLLASAGRDGAGHLQIVVVNDTAAAADYTLQLRDDDVSGRRLVRRAPPTDAPIHVATSLVDGVRSPDAFDPDANVIEEDLGTLTTVDGAAEVALSIDGYSIQVLTVE